MKEAQFHSEIKASVQTGIYVKLQDLPSVRGLRFTPTKPYDFQLIYQNKFIAIEAKMVKRYKIKGKIKGGPSLTLSDKRKEDIIRQIGELQKIRDLGFASYILVNVRGNFRGEEKKLNEAYFIEPQELLEAINVSSKSSINYTDLRKLSKYTMYRKKGIWELEKAIKYL